MKLEINKKQLELLQFMVLHFKCDDDEEEELILQLEQNVGIFSNHYVERFKFLLEG